MKKILPIFALLTACGLNNEKLDIKINGPSYVDLGNKYEGEIVVITDNSYDVYLFCEIKKSGIYNISPYDSTQTCKVRLYKDLKSASHKFAFNVTEKKSYKIPGVVVQNTESGKEYTSFWVVTKGQ